MVTPRPPIVSPYLTAAEAKDYLRLGSDRALYRLIHEHNLPHGHVGRHYRFDMRDLDAWIRGHGSALERARAEQRQIRAAR